MTNTYVFEKANDQHVRNLVVFGKAADTKLYYDAAYTEQVTQADAEYYFGMNCLQVKTAAGLFAPVAVKGAAVLTIDLASSNPTITSWAVKATV